MPKMSERERLADLETHQRKVEDAAVEKFSEREFKDVVAHAIRADDTAAVAALKALPAAVPPA